MILDWFFMDILQEEIFTALRGKLRQIRHDRTLQSTELFKVPMARNFLLYEVKEYFKTVIQVLFLLLRCNVLLMRYLVNLYFLFDKHFCRHSNTTKSEAM